MSRVLDIVAGVVIALLSVVALLRIVAHDSFFLLVWVNSVTLFAHAPAWIVVAWALARERKLLTVLGTILVALHVGWVLPMFLPREERAHHGARLRVVTANVLFDHRQPAALEHELFGYDADVLAMEEVSPRWQSRIDGAAMRSRYPHRFVVVRDGPRGIALLAKRPLHDARAIDLAGVPAIAAEIDVGDRRVSFYAVHLMPPLSPQKTDAWRRQFAQLALLARHGPRIVVGDFNATPHAAGLAALERAGLRDVHLALGRGWVASWPNATILAPPLLIDHVLISRELRIQSVREGRGVGSNHRPVVVDLRL